MTEIDRLKRAYIALHKENQQLTEQLCELNADLIKLKEKQEPKEPRKIDSTDIATKYSCTHRCVTCNVAFQNYDIQPTNYCGHCGQRLKEE